MANNKGGILLQCVKVEITGSKSSDFIFALFDNGSERTFIKKSVSESKEVVIEALEIDDISRAPIHVPDQRVCAEMKARRLELSSDCRISLLVGSDYYWDMTKRFQRVNEQGILREFNDSIQFVENRYCVKLPWIEGMQEKLENNREVALKRFNTLVRRFKRDSSLYKEYRKVVDGYLKEGIVELSDDLVDESTFYLPHHAVIREDKTSSRLRIVFDGTAHAEGEYSLNDCLHTGVNLYPNLFELLVQFRKNAVAYTEDVKQAYLQILIDPDDGTIY
ncbi:hypothetical protein HNY73_001634 [Argiope bruennichi]|uniref:Uncharacterized protein n=1 Tax=Argiope bruennichi TaxID=94029 RepID=A0A8T0FRY4_ARGBR|nr:hypothetical protein HNY73_001634 [Argiope bruennichi]